MDNIETNESLDRGAIDWRHVFANDCTFSCDSTGSGRFVKWLAIEVAKENKSVARDSDKKIIADYREEKK
jgi:hypothetical protein